MTRIQILELRPESKGGLWVRALIDQPARHDDNLVETVEFTFYMASCLTQTLDEILKRSENEIDSIVQALKIDS